MNVNEIFEELFDRYPDLSVCRDDIKKAYKLMRVCYENGGKVMICGNGGSAADSEHIAGELLKGFNLKRELSDADKSKFEDKSIADNLQYGLPAISLVSQTGLMTAFMNDVSPENVFAQQVYAYASNENDVLIALSTSGNSKNIVNAVITARAKGIKTVSITGMSGGKLNSLCDVTIKTPSDRTFVIQEYTLPVYHALCAMTEAYFFDK